MRTAAKVLEHRLRVEPVRSGEWELLAEDGAVYVGTFLREGGRWFLVDEGGRREGPWTSLGEGVAWAEAQEAKA